MILLNRENVMNECVTLARRQICEVLKVEMEHVTAKWEMKDEKLVPVFNVNLDEAKGVTEDQVREVMSTVYADMKAELESRLAGLKVRRDCP